jgi:hypothetical protein
MRDSLLEGSDAVFEEITGRFLTRISENSSARAGSEKKRKKANLQSSHASFQISSEIYEKGKIPLLTRYYTIFASPFCYCGTTRKVYPIGKQYVEE